MSEVVQIVDSLEFKLGSLFKKLALLEQDNLNLKTELETAAKLLQQQGSALNTLQQQYQSLKIANSLLGSNENKRDTKLKINSLIREIDHCIAQLAYEP